jgi:hypothetical protein
MALHKFEIFADYHQFYIQDEPADSDLSMAWTDKATAELLAVVPGVIGVGTVRNVEVPVEIEVLTSEPFLELDRWDRVNDCSIVLNSDKLVIAGCTDYFPDAKRIKLSPGCYRVRVLYGGLATLSTDGLEGEDHYRLQLWPGPAIEPVVVKAHAT